MQIQTVGLHAEVEDGNQRYARQLDIHLSPLSQIYLINLRRRLDRRDRMLFSLNELEIDVKVVDAVDGK